MKFQFAEARAPGKLIILGEHAVVKGSPAIAIALKRYTKASVSFNSLHQNTVITSHLASFKKNMGPCLLDKGESGDGFFDWAKALSGKLLRRNYSYGIDWKLSSDITPGSGMGSSAASINASFMALKALLREPVSKDSFWPFLTEIESICHGKSSGIDVAASLKGGCIQFQKGLFEALPSPDVSNWYFFNSGKPLEGTRECVNHSQKKFQERPDLFDQMHQIAQEMKEKIATASFDEIAESIRAWNRLQCLLGVVTEPVAQLISWIESLGASAKVCGAGALSGKGAGLVLVLASSTIAREINKKIILEPVEVDHEGACVTLLG